MNATTLTTIGLIQEKYPNNIVVFFKGKYYIL